jgi:hypothetical protein
MTYIVKVSKNIFIYYIQKVISYKRLKVILTIDIDLAHKYISNENAIKASNSFNGEVVVR